MSANLQVENHSFKDFYQAALQTNTMFFFTPQQMETHLKERSEGYSPPRSVLRLMLLALLFVGSLGIPMNKTAVVNKTVGMSKTVVLNNTSVMSKTATMNQAATLDKNAAMNKAANKNSAMNKIANKNAAKNKPVPVNSTSREPNSRQSMPKTVRKSQPKPTLKPVTMESYISLVSHQKFAGKEKFCQIGVVCRKGDGSFLLPKWMESHASKIEACGLRQVKYAIAISNSGSNGSQLALEGIQGVKLDQKHVSYDLLGTEAPHGERHLLAHDIAPSILMLDMFKKPDTYSAMTTTECITKSGKPCKVGSSKGSDALHPVFMVDSRISDTKEYLWPKSVLRLMRNSMKGTLLVKDLRDVYQWKVRSQASCFRSVLSTPVRTGDIPPDAFLGSNAFFSINRLTRKPVARSPLHARCTVKVLILNRYRKRFIEGADKLTFSILSYSKELSSKIGNIVVVEPEVVFFEKSSFHEQVSVMQESNIVVASHGDGNANFMFLRPKARVFEILPFGYSSDIFANISKAFGAIYEPVRSQPDIPVFSACVRHFNPDNSTKRDSMITAWENEAHAFQKKTVQKHMNSPSTYSVPTDEESQLRNVRQCASYQRISVDVRHLARKVVLASAEQCQVQGDLSFLKT